MMARRLLFLLPALAPLAAGCGRGEPPQAQDARAEKVERLARITAACGLPPETLQLVGPDGLSIRPDPDTEFAKVDCLLGELRKARLPLKLGFVGNEAYQTENMQ